MRRYILKISNLAGMLLSTLLLLLSIPAAAQPPVKKYGISKGSMHVALSKNLSEGELDAFVRQYDLEPLALKKLMRADFRDSVNNRGWTVVLNNAEVLVITKPLFSTDNLHIPEERIMLTDPQKPISGDVWANPVHKNVFGYNAFRNKHPFAIRDSVVTFFVRGFQEAKIVRLAGNFTNWESRAIPMTKVDSGWVSDVKLSPGKWLYKLIIDGNWKIDADNKTVENDGMGNDNSVYHFTNTVFRLDTFLRAKKIILAGSFNNWNESELQMRRTNRGWELPVFLQEGTYTYRYIVDGNWMVDPTNKQMLPNEFNDYNSVISIGDEREFILPGFQQASEIFLAGSFNGWRADELAMRKTNNGWKISYVLGPGNHEFKFVIDRKWFSAEGRPIKKDEPGSILVIEPNYTFNLRGYNKATKVYLSGEFNDWSPNAYPMIKQGNEWIIQVHLSPGKHLYKFVVDGKWIIDPANELWEENGHGDGNSVLWVSEK